MKPTLYDSPKYKRFTLDRNKVLEEINNNAQTDVSRMAFEKFEAITGFISHMALEGQFGDIAHTNYLIKQAESFIDGQFHTLASKIAERVKRMRKATFIITYLGELEAIARATQKTHKIMPHQFYDKLKKQIDSKTILGQSLKLAFWGRLFYFKQKILQKLLSGITQEKSPKEIVDGVKSVYPKVVAYKRPPIALKNLKESDNGSGDSADNPPKKSFDFYGDLVSDADWDLAVDAYKDTELPATRFDSSAGFDSDTGTYRYQWEVEQDLTDDFVNQVRQGQVEAATQLGVKDFIWVSVIDKKTCEVCCLPRNGKLVSEIESMLNSGELDANECDATVPPAHPNCRCDLAPSASTDEVEGPNWQEFGDWLES